MGNLSSCVACKVKDKNFKKTTGQLGLGDFKGASFNGEVQTGEAADSAVLQDAKIDDVTASDVEPSLCAHPSLAEMYKALQSNRPQSESIEHMDDVEKAANTIVSMTIFVASQVIYPAYMRYLEEDHPEVYQQYVCRPPTPTPSYEEQQLIVNVSSNWTDSFESFASYSQPSAMESIPEIVSSLESVQENDPSIDKSHLAGKPDQDHKSSVRFSLVAETISRADMKAMENLDGGKYGYDADDEGDLAQLEDKDEEDEDEDDYLNDDEFDIEHNDSLTMLSKKYDDIPMDPDSAVEVLKGLLEELSQGNIEPEKAFRVARLAKMILDERRNSPSYVPLDPVLSTEQFDTESEQQDLEDDGTIAQVIAKDSLKGVHEELFGETKASSSVQGAVKDKKSVGGLARLIVQKAIDLAVDILQNIEETEGPPRYPAKSPRPGSAPPASPVVRDIDDYIAKGRELDENLSQSVTRIRSSTSEFVDGVLDRVVKEVRSDIATVTEEPSGSSIFIRQAIDGAAYELARQTLDSERGPVVDWSTVQPFKTSSTSVTGQYVRDVITKVLDDMDKEGQFLSAKMEMSQSPSSAFASDLVGEAINQCLDDVKSDTMSVGELCSISAEILKSLNDGRNMPDRTRSLEGSLQQAAISGEDSVNSLLVEALITETLSRMKNAINGGEADMKEVLAMALEVDVGKYIKPKIGAIIQSQPGMSTEEWVRAALQKTVASPIKSDTSVAADDAVVDAIMHAVSDNDLSQIAQDVVAIQEPKLPVHTNSSLIAEDIVEFALDDAIGDLGIAGLERTAKAEKKVDDVLRDILRDTKGSDTHLASLATIPLKSKLSMLAENFVMRAIDDILDTINAESGSIKSPSKKSSLDAAINPNNAPNDERGPQPSHLDSEAEHIVMDLHENSSDEEDFHVHVEPVFKDLPIHIDHNIVEDSLSIVSVKRDKDLDVPLAPAPRNSFRDLVHPDLSRVRRFSLDSSEETMKSHIMSMSHRHIVLGHYSDDATNKAGKKVWKKLQLEEKADKVEREEEEVKFNIIHTSNSLEEMHELEKEQAKAIESTIDVKASTKSSKSNNKNKSSTQVKSKTKVSEKKSVSTTKSKESPYEKPLVVRSSISSKPPKQTSKVKTVSMTSAKVKHSLMKTGSTPISSTRPSASQHSTLSRASQKSVLSPKHSSKIPTPSKKSSMDKPVSKGVSGTKTAVSGTAPVAIASTTSHKKSTPQMPAASTKSASKSDAAAVGKDAPHRSDSPVAEVVEEEICVPKRGNRTTASYHGLSNPQEKKHASHKSMVSVKHTSSTSVKSTGSKGSGSKVDPKLDPSTSGPRRSSHQTVNLTPRPSSGYKPSTEVVEKKSSTTSKPGSGSSSRSSKTSLNKDCDNGSLRSNPSDTGVTSITLGSKTSQSSLGSLGTRDSQVGSQMVLKSSVTHSENESVQCLAQTVGSTGSLPSANQVRSHHHTHLQHEVHQDELVHPLVARARRLSSDDTPPSAH